jgi:hypothetical protein
MASHAREVREVRRQERGGERAQSRPARSLAAVPSVMMGVQRKAGNRATAGLLAVGQAKLAVGPAGDRYEREADAVATEVLSRLRSGWE